MSPASRAERPDDAEARARSHAWAAAFRAQKAPEGAEQEMLVVDGHIGNVEDFRTRARLSIERGNANIAGMQQKLYYPREGSADPEVQVIVCSLTAAGVGVNLQVASDVVLAELSWTNAEQTQAIDRVHRIGQTEPVTAWRIIAAQTIDARIAELIDSKAGLAARALDGADADVPDSADIQVEALVALLTAALEERQPASDSEE